MGQGRSEIIEQVVKFPPKQQSGNPADEAGQAVIAQIRKAAELANETATAPWRWHISLLCSSERPKIELLN
jgi:hypothetical protein